MSSYTELPECFHTSEGTPQTLLEISIYIHGLGVYHTNLNRVSFEDATNKIDHCASFTKQTKLNPQLLEASLIAFDQMSFENAEAKENARKSVLLNWWSRCRTVEYPGSRKL